MFCAQRLRNYIFNPNVKILCISFALLWATVLIFNTGVIVSGFVFCHAPGLQQEAELRYCHFFGNRKIAEIPDWESTSWRVYYWISLSLALTMACWQTFVTFSPFTCEAKADLSWQNKLVLLVLHD